GELYDIIFDTVGKISLPHCKHSLKPNGIFLEAGISAGLILQILLTSVVGTKKVKFHATGLRSHSAKLADLQFLQKLFEKGQYKAVIDRNYSLENIAEAHRYVDLGHKKGNVVITMNQS
ncbi:MAG: zinc-binding dehydrogenase, partial [bacterium]|nr:zinc-binding dehydrogenase [bacterium]